MLAMYINRKLKSKYTRREREKKKKLISLGVKRLSSTHHEKKTRGEEERGLEIDASTYGRPEKETRENIVM